MRVPAGARTALLLAALALAGAGGALFGVRLGERATEPGMDVVTIEAPERAAGTPAVALRSAGGFTGFGGTPALPGDVLRAGIIQDLQPGAFAIGAPGSTTEVRFRTPRRLLRIRPLGSALDGELDGALATGDVVVVRLVGGVPVGVLRVAGDGEPPGAGAAGDR